MTFAELGMHPDVDAALRKAGFSRPSRTQALTAPALLTGKDVVIAAETGSGKTLSYIAPMATLMLRMKQRQAQAERPRRFHALVLCPNGPLCQQVVSAVHGLRDEAGNSLLTAAQVNSSNPPPFDAPDIIVATPAGLMTLLNGPGSAYGRLWTEEGFQAWVKHVVLDEADLMFTHAYSKPVDRILQMLRSGDRRRVEAKLYEELGIDDDLFRHLPRELQVAGWTGGAPALLKAGFRPPNPVAPDAQFGPYWRRQYIFVAATMPSVTFNDVGSQIQYRYPQAEWISTEALHISKPQLTHQWKQVDDSTWQQELVGAIRSDPVHKAGKAKVLVFAKDTAAANDVSAVLEGEGIKHVVYHKNRPAAEREAALEAMHQGPGIMVCTDAAARGIDIQDITHVIQADFAPNAIDFIHRIGRTGRVDKAGRVTSLYRDHNKALVDVLQSYIAEGKPLEAAFSRARSFSKKLKRHGGQFIPRGLQSGAVRTQA